MGYVYNFYIFNLYIYFMGYTGLSINCYIAIEFGPICLGYIAFTILYIKRILVSVHTSAGI